MTLHVALRFLALNSVLTNLINTTVTTRIVEDDEILCTNTTNITDSNNKWIRNVRGVNNLCGCKELELASKVRLIREKCIPMACVVGEITLPGDRDSDGCLCMEGPEPRYPRDTLYHRNCSHRHIPPEAIGRCNLSKARSMIWTDNIDGIEHACYCHQKYEDSDVLLEMCRPNGCRTRGDANKKYVQSGVRNYAGCECLEIYDSEHGLQIPSYHFSCSLDTVAGNRVSDNRKRCGGADSLSNKWSENVYGLVYQCRCVQRDDGKIKEKCLPEICKKEGGRTAKPGDFDEHGCPCVMKTPEEAKDADVLYHFRCIKPQAFREAVEIKNNPVDLSIIVATVMTCAIVGTLLSVLIYVKKDRLSQIFNTNRSGVNRNQSVEMRRNSDSPRVVGLIC